jgi:hypothetical protein
MKTLFFRLMTRCVSGALLASILALVPAAVGQITLVEGGSVTMPVLSSPLSLATQVGVTLTSNYANGGFNFTVTSSVFTGVTPFGFGADKYVFAYKITNTSAPDIPDTTPGQIRKWGVTLFDVTGFQGVGTQVAEVDETGVVPGATLRSGDGNTITFSYPPVVNPGEQAPPIYPTENSRTLLVFTDATTSVTVSSVITNTDIDYAGTTGEVVNGSVSQSVNVYAPVAVPDSSSTSGLIGLALGLLAAGFRMRASSLR